MPTRPTKGDHGHSDRGSSGRGSQKATYGSSVSPEVAEEQRDAIESDESAAAAGGEESGDGPAAESDRTPREA